MEVEPIEVEPVVELFVEKQKERLADGKLRQEEYEAFLDGVNDALSYLQLEYIPTSETIEKSKKQPVIYHEIEEKYSRFREVAMYKNSFLRIADIAKQTNQTTAQLTEVADTVKAEL